MSTCCRSFSCGASYREGRTPAVVSGLVPDQSLTQLVPIVDRLERQAQRCARKADPGYRIAVTGLPVIAARSSADMIDKLNRGADDRIRLHRRLHRSWRSDRSASALACLLSRHFSRSSRRARCLRLFGYGLQFSSVVALTVSFGLGFKRDHSFPEPDDARETSPARTRRSRSSGLPCSSGRRSS